MKITTEQFIASFHSINGLTIGERRKNLFQLLNNTQRNEHSKINFGALEPKTHLEAVFKVEVMLYFQRVSDLLDVLKSENPILIDKVLKSKAWFWNEAFKNITGQQFVDDILGGVSFNTKVQLLNKLAIHLADSRKGDEYYESVKSKYGLYLAAKLIPCCSEDFIISSIEQDHIKLMESKLLLIVKKYANITEDILSALKGIGVAVSVEYDNVFKYIAHTDIILYLKLRKVYRTRINLGWRCTQRFVNSNTEAVIKNAQDYFQCFHSRQMVRSLKTALAPFYVNMFPNAIDDLSRREFSSLLKIIKYLRQPDINILLNTFKQVYGKELWDTPELVSLEFLEMLTSAERETKLQRAYKPDHLTDDKWMCYYPTKIAIPYLKERISLSSDINSRADLVGLLVHTCSINKDKVALAQICQFIINRHRNDNVSVRLTFLQNIRSGFDLEELDESHWTSINELIKIFTLNDETFYNASDFLQNYILYRLKHNLSYKEQLIEFCNLKTSTWNLFTKYPKYEKLCLLEFANIIPQLYKEKDLDVQNVNYISALVSYNQRCKHDPIFIFSYPNCIESVKKTLQSKRKYYTATNILSYCTHQKEDVNKCIQFVDQFLSVTESCELGVLIYLIQKHPTIVRKHIETITSLILKQFTSTNFIYFWKLSKNYEHLEIPQHVIKICMNRINEDSGDGGRMYGKKIAVRALAYLMPPNEYLQIVALHYPRELRADAATQAGQKTYELQEYIAESLKYITPPSEALESILAFCKGDYLKLIQSSLYSVCCNTNEDKLQPFFAELIGRAVSIRKHALHLTFHILDKAEIFSVLDKFMKTEKNASIRKFIFKHSFNFFVKNRDDYSWELVKLNITAVDVNDQEAFDILMQYNKIPRDYLDSYLAFTWEFLEKLPDPENKIEVKKTTLLSSIKDEIIPILGKNFCEPIIEKYFFKFSNSESVSRFQSAVQSFACNYIIFGESTYVSSLFAIIKNYINTTWAKGDTGASGRSCVQKFVETLCDKFLGDDDTLPHSEVLKNFSELWNEFLKPHEAFREYLYLKLTLIYVQKLEIHEIVTQLAGLCDSLVNVYGISIIGLITNKIASFLNSFVGSYEQEEIYDFINNIVENHTSLPCTLLVIKLIHNNQVVNKTKEKYEKIKEILQAKNDPVVKIFLHEHLTSSTDF